MPAVFALKGAMLSAEEWNGLLGEWQDGLEEPLYDEAVLDEYEDEASIRIWGPGSIRGAVLGMRRRGGHAAVMLESLASGSDWRMGFEIMHLAAVKSGGRWARGGKEYDAEALSPERAEEDAEREFAADSRIIAETLNKTGAKGLWLPNGIFDLTVTAADLEPCAVRDDVRRLEKVLAARVSRYATAPRLQPQPTEEDASVSFFDWDGGRALLRGRAELVAVKADDGRRAFVPFGRAVEILGDAVEPLGENAAYFPEMDPPAAADAREALLRESVTLESWLEDNAEELRAARSLSFLRRSAGAFASTVLRGGDPMLETRWLAPDEDFEEMLKVVCIVTMKAMRKMYVDGRDPDRAIGELVGEGLERPVAEAIVAGALEAMISAPEDRDGEGAEEDFEGEGAGETGK